MIREMSRFLRYGSIAVELNPVRQKAQLMRPPESGGRIATMSVPAGLQFRVQASRLAWSAWTPVSAPLTWAATWSPR
jgi:hypothetical protein